jgi:hypothetical protein
MSKRKKWFLSTVLGKSSLLKDRSSLCISDNLKNRAIRTQNKKAENSANITEKASTKTVRTFPLKQRKEIQLIREMRLIGFHSLFSKDNNKINKIIKTKIVRYLCYFLCNLSSFSNIGIISI